MVSRRYVIQIHLLTYLLSSLHFIAGANGAASHSHIVGKLFHRERFVRGRQLAQFGAFDVAKPGEYSLFDEFGGSPHRQFPVADGVVGAPHELIGDVRQPADRVDARLQCADKPVVQRHHQRFQQVTLRHYVVDPSHQTLQRTAATKKQKFILPFKISHKTLRQTTRRTVTHKTHLAGHLCSKITTFTFSTQQCHIQMRTLNSNHKTNTRLHHTFTEL